MKYQSEICVKDILFLSIKTFLKKKEKIGCGKLELMSDIKDSNVLSFYCGKCQNVHRCFSNHCYSKYTFSHHIMHHSFEFSRLKLVL